MARVVESAEGGLELSCCAMSEAPDAGSDDKRPQFGNRRLNHPEDVFQHNAWDNVEWDEEQKRLADAQVQQNSAIRVEDGAKNEFEDNASGYWNKFYETHQTKFFKDRNWLFTEFEELVAVNEPKDGTGEEATEVAEEDTFPGEKARLKVLEVGCGVGNTVFPVLQMNLNCDLFVYCCDFSEKAISLLKEHQLYDERRCHAFVNDLVNEWSAPFPKGTLDVVLMIFTLSAVAPEKMRSVIEQVTEYLKPGGLLLFRDYGRHDLAQLRFKKGRCLGDNFYVRGDGTRSYFFTEQELDNLLSESGLEKVNLMVDRRLQVNRSKQIKMYRVWIQAKYQKKSSSCS